LKAIFHITNGDYLADDLKKTSIKGEIIICREALISGPLQSDSLEDFWKTRSSFVSEEYEAPEKSYYRKVVPEFQKIIDIPEDSEVNLWFENDLFCQTNMWFCISLLSKKKNIKVYRVFPKALENEDHWKGFSLADSNLLEELFHSKIELREEDIQLGTDLWEAYQKQDKKTLSQLSESKSPGFQFLKEVIDAYLNTFPENDQLTNPEVFIRNLVKNGAKDFNSVFEEFQHNFGIYGYGDFQVKNMFQACLNLSKDM
jgi:hypothetical protein